MSLILSGTDGLSDVDGSAATPAIRGTDANTGIFFPAADQVAISTGGTQRAVVDASGNVGIGTTTPAGKLDITSGTARMYFSNQSATAFFTAVNTANSAYAPMAINGSELILKTGDAERMRIDSSGNVGIGTSSPAAHLQVYGAGTTSSDWTNGDATGAALLLQDSGLASGSGGQLLFASTFGVHAGIKGFVTNGTGPAGDLVFQTRGTSGNVLERMRIDASGNLLVGTTNSSLTAGVGVKFVAGATEPFMAYVINTAAGASNYHLYNINATNNGYRFFVTANGGIQNYSGNNVNLSDERIKTNIELSGNYLEKICAIPVKLFNYRDEPENEQRTLGVIAQDVEAVAPEFINNDGWKGTDPEDGVPLKTVYTTDITFALMKCIQEQQALITALTTRITALESN